MSDDLIYSDRFRYGDLRHQPGSAAYQRERRRQEQQETPMNETAELRKLQDRYLRTMKRLKYPPDLVVDCQHPTIKIYHLEKNLYPQLEKILQENLKLAARMLHCKPEEL